MSNDDPPHDDLPHEPLAAAAADDLIVLRPQGLYCPPGDFYIDPWRPVERAVITHAHADHARPGHAHYLCARPGAPLLHARLGAVSLQCQDWGVALEQRGVRLSLHPAGHVLGSAQVRIEHRGRIWVASGDYFVSGAGDVNPTCAAFEPLRCHCFISESTFGLPVYRWRAMADTFADINAALDDISTFRSKALPQMANNILEMDTLTKATEEAIKRMEKGTKAEPAVLLELE